MRVVPPSLTLSISDGFVKTKIIINEMILILIL